MCHKRRLIIGLNFKEKRVYLSDGAKNFDNWPLKDKFASCKDVREGPEMDSETGGQQGVLGIVSHEFCSQCEICFGL